MIKNTTSKSATAPSLQKLGLKCVMIGLSRICKSRVWRGKGAGVGGV